jgi:hypothetical protein
MVPHAHHRHPSRWPLTVAVALALVPGCSGDSEPADELVPSWDSRGIVTYRYVPRTPPATAAPTAAAAVAQDAWLRQQELEEAEGRRRRELLAYQERRRELEEQWRRQRQQEDAERAAWWRDRREWHRQEQERRRTHQEQQSRWLKDQIRRGQAEAEHWLRVSQPFDIIHLQDQR